MALGPKIMAELKAAMKAKDTVARDTLRMLKSQLGQAELATMVGGVGLAALRCRSILRCLSHEVRGIVL